MERHGLRAGRATLVAAIAVLVACAAVLTVMYLRTRPPARIVLVVVDTLRRDRVSAYGGAVATPNIDAFAARGTVFRRAVGAFHQTTMSMAALFTGRTPSLEATPGQALAWTGRTWCGLSRLAARTGDDGCVPASVPTLAEALRDAGYHTVGVASNLLLFRPAGYDRGFDDWIEVGASEDLARIVQAGKFPVYDPLRQAGHEVNRAVQRWLADRRTDRFFLYVHYMDAHDYLHRKIPYDQGVRNADAAVGELRRLLDEAGLLARTTVVITADHGESLGERHEVPSLPTHLGNPSYEPVLGVPLIVSPPVEDDPERLVRSDDTFRLLRRLAHLDDAPAIDLDGGEHFLTEQLFRTYRRGRWKSVWPRGQDTAYLFDLDSDPGEVRSVAAAHPEELAAHRSRVDELSRRLGAAGASGGEMSPEDLGRLRALGYVQ